MVDRPIIFSGAMVRALLAGRKTQTRRLATSPLRRCQPGDRLYVREAWRADGQVDAIKPRELSQGEPIFYELDGGIRATGCVMIETGRLRPGMHMPRWASRLTLIAEAVRIEPLQLISEADAIAEGLIWRAMLESWTAMPSDTWPTFTDPRRSYAGLWQSLHTKEGQRWDDNPDVVVLTFRVERANIDQVPA
jgi:hypothetical protein